jgi:uncharacterized protein
LAPAAIKNAFTQLFAGLSIKEGDLFHLHNVLLRRTLIVLALFSIAINSPSVQAQSGGTLPLATPDEASQLTVQAIKDREAGFMAEARAGFQKACNRNDFLGCYNLGVMIDKNQGGPYERGAARAAYSKACDGNYIKGCFDLGVMLRNGIGMSLDLPAARIALSKACDGSNLDACVGLGYMLNDEESNFVDRPAARTAYRKACDGNIAISCSNLGIMLIEGKGGLTDLPAARLALRKACDGNEYDSCFTLGIMLNKGLGGPADLSAARIAYSKICKRNNIQGCFIKNPPILSSSPASITAALPENPRTVYLKACDSIKIVNCFDLGLMLEFGRGGPPDLLAARAAYRRACEGGRYEKADSCMALGQMLKDGKGGPVNLPSARAYFQKACDAGRPDSCINLGIMLFDTKDSADREKAKTMFDKACRARYRLACGVAALL